MERAVATEVINRLRENIRCVYLGNPNAVDLVLVGLLAILSSQVMSSGHGALHLTGIKCRSPPSH